MIGTEIGSCRIEERVARGGTAIIYRGVNTRTGGPHAVKVIPRSVPGYSDHRNRLFNEWNWSSRVEAPGIVKSFEAGETGNGCYLIQEWAPGRPLHHILREETRPGRGLALNRALRIAADLAEALSHLHAQKVVHADLKPPNVLCCDERTRICDLGLAVREGALRPPGLLMGTPFYMAPEMTSGRLLDRRTDIWSLGVILFEMLTGARPFGLRTDSPEDIVKAVRSAPLPRLLDGQPDAVRVLTEFLLERNRMQRPHDALLLAKRLHGLCGP
jgi:serine/threonine-protein kinase